MDAIDGVHVIMRRYKHNRHVAYLSKPTANFYAFATSFEINIDQGHVGPIAHSKCPGFVSTWGHGASVEAKLEHRGFEIKSDQELVLDD